jgi:hypothetical protein
VACEAGARSGMPFPAQANDTTTPAMTGGLRPARFGY